MSSIPGLRFGEFQGFPALLISTPFSKAAISLFGVHVPSFVTQCFDDVPWVSPTSNRPPNPIGGAFPFAGRTLLNRGIRRMHRSTGWCALRSGT